MLREFYFAPGLDNQNTGYDKHSHLPDMLKYVPFHNGEKLFLEISFYLDPHQKLIQIIYLNIPDKG